MLVHKIVCPKCASTLTSKAGVAVGTGIACPKCKEKFKVATPRDEADDEFEVVDEEEEEEAPRKPAPKPVARKKPIEDDEDDHPQSKRRSRNDEDDDRPKKKKKKKSRDEELSAYEKLKSNIWVRVSVLGVLLATLGVVAYLRWGRDKPAEKTETAAETEKEEYAQLQQPINLPKNQPKTNTPSNPQSGPPKHRPRANSAFEVPGELSPIRPLAISGDGKRVAVAFSAAGPGPGRTQVWDIAQAPKMLGEFPGRALAISPSGARVFTDGAPAVFEVATKERIAEVPVVVPSFAAFLDEDTLLTTYRTGPTGGSEGRVTLWNIATNTDAGSFDVSDGRFADAAVVKGGRELWLFMAGRLEIECWDVRGKSFIRKIAVAKSADLAEFGPVCSVAHDGSVFTSVQSKTAFYDETGKSIARMPAFAAPTASGFVPGSTLYIGFATPEGVAAGYRPMDVIFFDCKTQKPTLSLTGRVPEPALPHVAISADRRVAVVAAGAESGKVNSYILPDLGAVPLPKADPTRPPEADLPRFDGEWAVTAMNINGEQATAETIADLKVVFKDGQVTIPLENGMQKLKLDASKSPAEIDIIDGSNQARKGIYRFADGLTVELCYTILPGAPRPKDFKVDVDSSEIQFVLKRLK